MLEKLKKRSSMAILGAVVVVCAACDPGWVNPVVGTGDGSGQVPGSVAIASDQVAFGDPTSMVDLGARGFVVYDASNCVLSLVTRGITTRFAGTGVCGHSGDGGPATEANIDVAVTPLGGGITADSDGDVYFVELGNDGNRCFLRRIDSVTGVVETVPGCEDEVIFGVSGEDDGQLTYLSYRDASSPGSTSPTWELRRIDAAGVRTTVVSVSAPEGFGVPKGFARVGDEHYVTWSNGAIFTFDHGVVTSTPVTTPASVGAIDLVPETALNGVVYGIVYPAAQPTFPVRNLLFALDTTRLGSPDALRFLTASTQDDPGTDRQMGQAGDLHLTPNAVALTTNDNLLIASGHVVYRLIDVAHAPSATLPLTLGSPLNYFGRSETTVTRY